LKLNGVLHTNNLVVTVVTEEVPYVDDEERLEVETLRAGFTHVVVRYGFMEDPDVPAALAAARSLGLDVNPGHVTYILSNNTLIAAHRSDMGFLQKRLFVFLSRNALRPSQFFRLPVNRVIELGMQIKL
jgi:KUP system potassium uptake protein